MQYEATNYPNQQEIDLDKLKTELPHN